MVTAFLGDTPRMIVDFWGIVDFFDLDATGHPTSQFIPGLNYEGKQLDTKSNQKN